MKKILLSILIVLLIVLCYITISNGMNLFGIEILSYGQIKDRNDELRAAIEQATALASADYKKIMDDMETDLKKLKEEKKSYTELVGTNEDGITQTTNQSQKYEIEYLWTAIGKLATSEGVEIQMDLVTGTGTNIYNLNFTVQGSYIGIADFVYDLENDSALGFKIENFSLTTGGSTDNLKATFICKNIEIKNLASGSVTNGTTQQNANGTDTTETTGTIETTNATGTYNSATNTTSTTSTTGTTTNAENTTSSTNTVENIGL